MANVITNIAQLTSILANAKAKGQFVTIEGETEIKLNKFPTDGSEKVRIADDFKATHTFKVQYHFGQDYEKTMAKIMGVETYNASDNNRIHLVPNVVMQYISTGTTCLIYMPTAYTKGETKVNGHTATENELAYIARYKSKSNSTAPLPYRTIGVKNVKSIAIGGERYTLDIQQQQAAYKQVV